MNDDKNYFHFKREMWQHLEISEDQLLTAEELEEIRGLNDRISLEDISEIYLPLIKLVAMEYHEAIFIHEEKLRFLQKKGNTRSIHYCLSWKRRCWKKHDRPGIQINARSLVLQDAQSGIDHDRWLSLSQ